MNSATDHAPKLTVTLVVPVYNERDNVDTLLERIGAAVAPRGERFDILFIDDGSTDETAVHLRRVALRDDRVEVISLSRNFGHQAALVAGLSLARGDAVVTLDGDLQHPPELIPQLVAAWRNGADIVQAVRREPADASGLKRASSRGFYRLLAWLTRLNLAPGTTDFRLMSREAVDGFLSCPERCRFNRGLVRWIGFSVHEIPYDAARRSAGQSKYSYRAMLRLAGDAIFGFSALPVRLAGLAGVCVSLAAAAYLVFVVWAYFAGRTVAGWSSLLATTLILGGVNLIVLWILGEYVGRLYEEAKQRPLYIVRAPRAAAEDDEPQRADVAAREPGEE